MSRSRHIIHIELSRLLQFYFYLEFEGKRLYRPRLFHPERLD
jgi:hypothetical protein